MYIVIYENYKILKIIEIIGSNYNELFINIDLQFNVRDICNYIGNPKDTRTDTHTHTHKNKHNVDSLGKLCTLRAYFVTVYLLFTVVLDERKMRQQGGKEEQDKVVRKTLFLLRAR